MKGMLVNFPNAPTNGQTFQPAAGLPVYVWNSAIPAWQIASNSGATAPGGPYAPINSPVLTGDPQGPTAAPGDNDTSLATTAFVSSAIGAMNIGATYAPIASPTFTGDPKAPTPATADNDTSVATTAFVKAQNYLTDAPNDGVTYGRKSLAWAAVVGGAIVSDTAPTGTLQNGQMWWASNTGSLYLYFADPDSSQWIMLVPGSSGTPGAVGDLDMQGFNIKNVGTLTVTGTATSTFAGALTVAGTITANQNFVSSTATAVLATTGSGNIYLRPVGAGVTTGEIVIGGNGSMTIWGAAGANSQVVYADEAGTAKGYTYWNRGDNTLRMYHVSSGGVALVDASGAFSASGNVKAGTGYLCKAGSSGGFGGNIFNLRWNGVSATELWIDTTMTGGITVSDYRIKKDVADLPSTWDKVKALRPISYSVTDYGTLSAADDTPQWGFIAHELQETLLMSASTGVKDAENVLQSPNWMPVVAALVKTVQELQARVEALEATRV
jgi:hypothetical protein